MYVGKGVDAQCDMYGICLGMIYVFIAIFLICEYSLVICSNLQTVNGCRWISWIRSLQVEVG